MNKAVTPASPCSDFFSHLFPALGQLILTSASLFAVLHATVTQAKCSGSSNFWISYFLRSHKTQSGHCVRSYEIVIILPMTNMFFPILNPLSAL